MKYLLLAITFIFVLISCKSDNDSEIIMNNEFYSLYYTENILPSIQQFKKELELQKQYTLDFKISNSDLNFQKMLDQWLLCSKAYSRAEVYNFGLIKQRFFDLNIYNYPVNITEIESNIQDKATYNTNYFNSKSTVNKGLATLEYLLYADFDTENAKSLLINDAFRLDYTLGVTDELIRQADLIINTWLNEYMTIYINANENICTSNAKCLTINQIINVLDLAKVTKIGKPSGFEKSNNTAPTNLEAFRSRNSLILIQAMLEEVKHVYFDSDTNISILVNGIDNTNKISNEINSKFNDIEQQITLFNNNLYNAINTNPELIRPIYDTLKELNTLFAVDVTSILSVTILPTDNDGD